MRKILLALALIASPATAQEIVEPGPNATSEERLAYMRALVAQSQQQHQQIVAQNEQMLRETYKKIGIDPNTVGTRPYSGCRYACTTTVIVGSKVYRFRVSRY